MIPRQELSQLSRYHDGHVKRTLLWLILAAAIIAGIALYRSRSGIRLNVAPDAEREIERAKRR